MRRSLEKEMMDLPDQPKQLLEEDLRNLRIINRYLGGYRGVMRGIAQLTGERKINGFSLLDAGTGSGDIPAAIARWARSRGVSMKIVALDPEAITVMAAAVQTKGFPEISVVRGDAMAPPFPSSSFDFVLASQLLHHFSEEQIIAVLKTWSVIARQAIIVSDLIRHPVAYCGIRVITQLFTRNIMTLTDGPLSVKRAFTRAEWRELFRRAAIGPFQISSVFPYRMVTIFSLAGSR